jgi:hypothetical protein
VVTVPTTPEKAKKEGSHSKISGEKITRPWDIYLEENKGKWKELSIKGDTIHRFAYTSVLPLSRGFNH